LIVKAPAENGLPSRTETMPAAPLTSARRRYPSWRRGFPATYTAINVADRPRPGQ
jgi:hypothetical protein